LLETREEILPEGDCCFLCMCHIVGKCRSMSIV
jgi:hypothetical protein